MLPLKKWRVSLNQVVHDEKEIGMRLTTLLEAALLEDEEFAHLKAANTSAEAAQKRLDEIATKICEKVGADALIEHMRVVYDKTANTYSANPEHKHVPDALLTFMGYCSDRAHVLDLGCGFGRDATFMALRDPEVRKEFMGRMKDGKTAFERFGLPTKSIRVVGIDCSEQMVLAADRFAEAHGLFTDPGDFSDTVFLDRIDMHKIGGVPCFGELFDGVWSSAALFMHTPQTLIHPAFESVAKVLRFGGIFGVSYANNSGGLPYDNLRYSRTGEIKYFSRPTPRIVAVVASASGFILREEQYSDFEMAGKVQKDFFVTQFFQKSRCAERKYS
ncbi:MAG: class I SAM-dependent methyltransferase [Patescibacteria group bacterium]